jgi:NAD(P) transhydrogenase subunit alpha
MPVRLFIRLPAVRLSLVALLGLTLGGFLTTAFGGKAAAEPPPVMSGPDGPVYRVDTTLINDVQPAAGERSAEQRASPLAELPAEPQDSAATPANFVTLLFVLMLATFIGLEVIRNVSRLLHTPLMSLTNAISAIAVVGSILLVGKQETPTSTILGAVALAASMTNIVSGFLITDRMLKMFKKREPAKS